ncbi:uncharacterized protein B0J16DRAFT_170299 [Fusarium flagelliforme]|uniref:uncharacterized protein n=1 Tax=Fusarium flagelliforme TaxID=2675880 RepID=UPI001E8D5254|nr:uncharacterized protein B0J16DRAFT_170299 [Fusarium flagelliforme]KAH7179399.1 hypothetical protein B0J16DRAFT_170299 [Fusarium flagelliforme]
MNFSATISFCPCPVLSLLFLGFHLGLSQFSGPKSISGLFHKQLFRLDSHDLIISFCRQYSQVSSFIEKRPSFIKEIHTISCLLHFRFQVLFFLPNPLLECHLLIYQGSYLQIIRIYRYEKGFKFFLLKFHILVCCES